MPRHEDRGSTRLYVGRLSTRTRSRDLEDLFSKYGRVREVDVKHDFAFVEFSDPRDADQARHYLNGRDFEGHHIVVEFARRAPRGGGKEYSRGSLPGTTRCYNCGTDGHWARDCKAGDCKDKCYRCGQRGHIERNCRTSPRSYQRSRSRSRSPVRRRSRSRSLSRSSRSPRRRDRFREGKRSRSRSLSHGRRDYHHRRRVESPPVSPAGDTGAAATTNAAVDAARSPSPEAAPAAAAAAAAAPARNERSPSRSRSPAEVEQAEAAGEEPAADGASRDADADADADVDADADADARDDN